jgi:hypothetical protein
LVGNGSSGRDATRLPIPVKDRGSLLRGDEGNRGSFAVSVRSVSIRLFIRISRCKSQPERLLPFWASAHDTGINDFWKYGLNGSNG